MTTTPFVAQFPIATKSFIQTLEQYIGQNTAPSKYAAPSKTNAANIKAFLEALNQYDINPTPALVTQLNNLMQALDISAIRLQELPDDAAIFYPNPTKGKTIPLVTGAVLTWRFGLTKETGNPATYNNPLPQFIIFDPHSGQDGTPHAVTTQFLAGAKALLSNAFNPNVAFNPKFKHGPIGPGNIQRFTDPAHSNTTAFVPFGTTLYSIYPKAGCTVTHGMTGSPDFQLTAGNDYNGQFFKHGQASFTTLLSIALAIAELPSGEVLPTNPSVVSIHSTLPGYLVRNGITAPISSAKNRNSPIRLGGLRDNTDNVGHMANGVQNVWSRGNQTDRSFLVEMGPRFRNANSKYMEIFALAQANATQWYAIYDPTIQDPWQLAQRFPDVYNNMTLYPNLFDPAFVTEYKLNGTNPYNKSSSTAAVQDMDLMMAQVQQDLTDADATPYVPNDLVNYSAQDLYGDASSALTFSSAAAKIGRSSDFAAIRTSKIDAATTAAVQTMRYTFKS